MLEGCFPALSKMAKLLEVIMLSVLDRERRQWRAFDNGLEEEEAIFLRLRSQRSLRYQELESQLVTWR